MIDSKAVRALADEGDVYDSSPPPWDLEVCAMLHQCADEIDTLRKNGKGGEVVFSVGSGASIGGNFTIVPQGSDSDEIAALQQNNEALVVDNYALRNERDTLRELVREAYEYLDNNSDASREWFERAEKALAE
jgi:hypothetical protein